MNTQPAARFRFFLSRSTAAALRRAPLALLLVGLAAGRHAAAEGLPAFDLRPELTGQAIFSCQQLTMSGNVEVDSRGVSTGAAHGAEGHVRSNAGITLSGNVKIFGDAIAGPGAQVAKSGNVSVSGTVGSASSPLSCVPIPLAPLETQLLASNDNSRIPRSDKNKLALGGASGRIFTLSGNDGVTIPAGNYYFDSLTLSGNSSIRLEGRVNILVKGAISISGGGLVRQLGNHFQLRLWTRGSVAISSNAKLQGFLYAPENAVSLSGGADIEGTLFAKNFSISGTVKIRRSVDDSAPLLALSAPLEGQMVGGCSVLVQGQAGDAEENGLAVTVNGQPVTLTGGQFSATVALAGADPSLVVVTATDSTGAATQLSRRITLVPPALSLASPPPGSLLGQRIVALSGAAGHAATVTVDGIAASLAGGNWSIPAFDLGADGAKTMSLAATYCGGTVLASYSLELDTAAPVVAIDGPLPGDLFGSSPIVVTGTIAEAHLASLKVAGIDAAVDGGRFTVTVPIAEGATSLAATATDALGRATVSSPVAIELDSIAPAVIIDSPSTGTIVGVSPVVVSGHSEDPNLASVKVEGLAATLSGANFSAVVPLAEGDNSLAATARDRAGNSTLSASVIVVLDTAPPVVSITAGELPALTREESVTVIGSALDPHLDAVSVNGIAATLAGASFSAVVPLAEGANSLVATAGDVLAPGLPGHQASSAPFSLVRDSTPPVLAVTEPAADALLASSGVVLRGTVEDVHLLRVTVGGQEVPVVAGSFELALELSEGAQTIAVRAVDRLDQATEVDLPVVVDTISPVLTVTSPLEGALALESAVTVTGTASDPQLDTVTVNGELAAVEPDGSFSITVDLGDGTEVTVEARDLAGHRSERVVRLVREVRPPTLAFDSLPDTNCSPGGIVPALGGTFEDDQSAAPAISLEVRPAAGAARTYPVSIAGNRFTAVQVDLGNADGFTTLVATATDADGGVGRAVATVRIDALAPQLQITEGGAPLPSAAAGEAPPPGAAPQVLGRQVAFGAIVSDGATGPGPAAVFTLDGQPYLAGAPIAAAGNHLLVARATDCAGRTAVQHAFFRLDREAPRLLSTDPPEGARLEAGIAAYRGTSDGDLAAATVNGRPAAVGAGSFRLEPFPWREGANTVEIELIDAAGLRASYQRSFTVDAAPLSVAIVENGLPISPGQVFTRPVSPRAVASTSAATLVLSLGGAPFAAGSTIGQSGDYTLIATATAGGRTATATATFRLDLAAGPTIRITAPEDASEVAGNTVEVRGTSTGEGLSVEVNGHPAALSGGAFVLAAYPLAENEPTTITATVKDRLGRTASSQVTVLSRPAGPRVLILDPAEGTVTSRDRIDVAGAVVDPLSALQTPSVTISGGAGPAVALPLAADGSFRARDVALGSGSTVLTVSAVDRLGQTGSSSVTVYRDGHAPTIALVANGQPLAEGAVFGTAVSLLVSLGDDSGGLTEKSVSLNGQRQPAFAGDSLRLELPDDGGYLLSVVARDDAGNQARAERSFVIDRGGCGLGEIYPAANSTVEEGSVTLAGRSGGATSLKVRLPGGAGAQEFTAQLADGTFLVAGVPLQLGDNALDLICADAAGRTQSFPHPLRRVAAGQGPAIEILSPAGGALLGVDRIAVSGTLSGGEATVNGIAATVAGGNPKTFSLAQLSLAEGPNVIGARVVDAGRSATDRVVVTRDSQAPRLSITSPDSGTPIGIAGEGPAAIDVSGRVELDDEPLLPSVVVSTAAGTVTATIDPATGVFLALAVPLQESLAAGEAQLLTAVATDSLGHRGQAQAEIFLDPAGPAIVLNAPADLGRYSESSPAQIAVDAEVWAQAGATVTVNGAIVPDAGIVWSAADAEGRRHGSFSAQVALPTRDGSFGIIARVVAADQRHAQARRLLIKDSSAPAVVEMLPASGSRELSVDTMPLVLFSEPLDRASLAGPNGLALFRLATGEVQASSFAVAGNAVAVVPAAALAAGESYELRAGLGISDLAGHALAAARATRFEVAGGVAAAAPSLDPLPAVFCPEGPLELRGQAAAGAAVKVKDGSLSFTGSADAAGRFAIRVPLASNGWHYLSVFVVDESSGSAGPAVHHALRVDCSAPTVRDVVFDRAAGTISIFFSESMDPASLTLGSAEAAIRLRDAEDPAAPYQSGDSSGSQANLALIALDAAETAWWRDRPVRLEVGAPAKDVRGNPMSAVYGQVFFPGSIGLSGGFLFGEAWDDTKGRPLAGAAARLHSGLALDGPPLDETQTDGRGRYTFAGQVPAGRYAVVVEKPGFAPVIRRLALEPSQGAVAFDARLTPRAEPMGSLDPAAGGRLAGAAGFALEAAPFGLPGEENVVVTLTALSGQGLPDFLPLGYTPAVAAELRLVQGAAALGESSVFAAGNVTVELPLPAWIEAGDLLVAAQYQLGSGRWLALAEPQQANQGGRNVGRLAPIGPGTVAILVADRDATYAPPRVAAYSPLEGAEPPAETPAFAAKLSLDPEVVAPTGRSLARVVARSQDGVTPWPSGFAVQAFVEERLILAAGQGQLLEAPYVADLLLYHSRLSAAEQAGNTEGSAGALDFVVSPSPRAAQVLLDVGFENIRLYPFPEETQRGQVVGPTGGTVGDPAEVELTVPEGALSSATLAEVALLSAAELAELPAVAGFRTLAAVKLELEGKELARPATLRILRPAATADEVAGDPRLILAELERLPEDGRGAFARLASRVLRQGSGAAQRLVAPPEAEGGALPLDGVVREGTYLLLEAAAPLGFATGLVRGQGSALQHDARVDASPLGTADLSRLTGRYVVPVAAGAARPLRARHPSTDEAASATVTVGPGQVVVADLTVVALPPVIQSLQPAAGAANQPTLTTVAVTFSEAIDPASVGSGTLELELADSAGRGAGVFISGRVAVSGSQVRFESELPLPPGRRFVARFQGGVRDLEGTFYAGATPVEWTFTTSTVVVPGGQVDPAKFHAQIPENGVVRIWADPGALPLAQTGQPPWTVAPYLVGPFAGRDPQRPPFSARTDGSFEGSAGRAGYEATLASRVWVVVLDASGQVAAEFEVGPLTSADGNAFIARSGEATIFRSAEGIVAEVPAAAFEEATLVRLSLRPAASVHIATPRGLAIGAVVELDFAGQARETLRLHVPAPAAAAAGAQVFVGEERQMPWGPALHFLTYGGILERDGGRFLSNDPSLQAEPDLDSAAAGSQVALRAGLGPKAGGDGRTCQDVMNEGGGPCFAQERLPEFVGRRLAIFYHEAGVDWSLIAGLAAPIAQGVGLGSEAILNALESTWVFISRLGNSVAGFWMMPAITTEPITLERRDVATGWVLQSQAYAPVVPDGSDLVLFAPLQGDTLRRPMLVAAEPFDVLTFAAPAPGNSQSLRLDLEATTETSGRLELRSVPGLPLATNSSVALFDLEPIERSQPPIALPGLQLCGNENAWALPPVPSSARLLLVVGPGALDPRDLESFRLEFDFPLQDLEGKNPDQVAKLRDLGPAEGCGSPNRPGFPRRIEVGLRQELGGKRLVVTPHGALAGGHRFELELIPSGLIASGADPQQAGQYSYWSSAPTRFAFATRAVEGTSVGTIDPSHFPFGDASTARDLLQFGNLLLVGSDSGRIVAIDTSDPAGAGKLKLHAISNSSTAGVRTFATDGHNRLFYSEIFGSSWALKALRVEDARAAAAQCLSQPEWAAGIPCFDGVAGSIRIATLPGNALATSQFLGAGALPTGTPSDLEVLTQDETGETLDLEAFYETYLGSFAGRQPDSAGVYTFDLPLRSTYLRFEAGASEPSKPGQATPNPRTRAQTCAAEEAYDRFQRVTLDNLTTGQSWSVDVENPWPLDAAAQGDGRATVVGVRARKNDRLRLRYNLKTLGYVSITGSGVSVADLNRAYGLPQPAQTAGGTQCGRRLGRYEGADIEFPACAISGSGPEGIRYTPALEVHSETGCASGQCRGTGSIDVYSPLMRVGGVHSKTATTDPGALRLAELAACISDVGGLFAQPVDAALANDVMWVDYGLRGNLAGVFQENSAPGYPKPAERKDLLFLALGNAGVFVFDVSSRVLSGSNLVGHFLIPNRNSLRLQYDGVRGLLLIGGSDFSDPAGPRPVIDVWDVRYSNAAPGTRHLPASTATIFAPWSTRHLGLDASGTGLLYSWDPEKGPLALPIDRPRFTFSGLYLAADAQPPAAGQRPAPVETATSLFVPLGLPMQVKAADEATKRFENDKKGTAAFRLRIALPGSLGPTLTAKVQSLRVLPEENLLGRAELGEAVALPGGPGWPDQEVTVKLRRLGISGDGPGATDEGGPLGSAYNLYESVETLLLIADPRAGRNYRRQNAAGEADEEGQCRRCAWPVYLPDPATGGAALAEVKEILAGGRYLRAFLAPDGAAGEPARLATEAAIAFFAGQGSNYPLPAGWAEVAAPADSVPSPLQSAQAEPAQNAATFSPGELGIAVALAGGDLLHATTDHAVAGRGLPFTFERSYRSLRLGYGPLGSGGWDAGLFAHLREISTTGEVEYHDGSGQVFRFYPSKGEDPGPGWERDDRGEGGGEGDRSGSYYVPAGLYLRLQKLANRGGWRLIGRDRSVAEFDEAGRLRLLSDRLRQAHPVGEQGNTLELRYDAFGKLDEVLDDLGRRYRFEYFESRQTDGAQYGLLKSLTDFAGREVRYDYDAHRLLQTVQLPEVSNQVAEYAQHSYRGAQRPRLAYEYLGADPGAPAANSALVHGDFAKLRLAAVNLPSFGAFSAPRARFAYDPATGRLLEIGFPTPANQNTKENSVAWRLAYSATPAPASRATVTAPWGHELIYELVDGRTRELEQQLAVIGEDGTESTRGVKTSFTYRPDGRLETVTHPDGGVDELGYADASPAQAAALDRLALPNVRKAIRRAPEGARGSAGYAEIVTLADYEVDNQVSKVIDGLSRTIELAVPVANQAVESSYQAEGVRQEMQIDPFGRSREQKAGNDLQKATLKFTAGPQDRPSAGLLEKIEVGAMFSRFERDAAGNVERQETSQGTSAEALYDEWDRTISSVSGLTTEGLAPLGAPGCGSGAGARSERAFDAAGHLIRERGLQDYVAEGGQLECRWVETRYTYNAREQVVEVRQTQLSDPNLPGAVRAGEQLVGQAIFDLFGRLAQSQALNAVDGPVTTSYRYDSAGRAVGVKVGNAAEQVQAFDAKNRVVFRSDGDQAIWRGRYDAWDRLWMEHQPTGAVVEHFYDPSNRPTQQKVWAGDPTGDPETEPRLLKDTRTTFTSFGEVKRVVEVLTTDEAPQIRVTERDFDAAGRVVLIASGPANEAGELDRAAARREQQIRYEPLTGRVLRQSSGGSLQTGTGEDQGQEIEQRFEYAATSPWPTKVQMLERLPGGPLQETTSATFRYDAAGRVVEERRSDGSLVETLYDRLTGQPLRVSTGAGSTSYASYDGAGRQLLSIRPGGRGETLYAYDLDGRLRRQVTKTEAEEWETSYGYDALGRPTRVDYEDGSFATSTYNADSTVAERRTRDGLTLSHTYDAANRLLSVVPSGEPAETMAELDAGNATTWDPLSRPTEHRRGDPSLAVAYPSYDLGSRPAGEKVGDREALGWAWDLYDRAIETRLPLGVGRNADSIAGFKRQFDTLNHLTGIEALSGQPQTLPLGGTWNWSGGRLWGMTTRGTLGTAVRYGYLGGDGAQPPGQSTATWQLGTMTWGAGAESATAPPSQIWGQFAFGYRGIEAAPSDGAKVGRLAVPAGKDLFAGTGWSWNYDAGVRLAAATPGRGSLEGASEENSPAFRYQYGKADELQKIIDEAAGKASSLETGPYGRILSRDGVPFEYDTSGRRTEDDRHSYRWNWRGELVEVTVKQGDFAGHQVKYQYDAQGRLHTRSQYGPADSNGHRLLQEKRAFLWEGQSLLAEAAYSDEAETQIQWRRTYVPGPSGLDDAIQVKVENFNAPGIPGSRLYTYLRDELGTVIGIVGEEETQNPANPTIAARYLYNPYGEAHLEKGLEIRQVRFDESVARLNADFQTIEDPTQRSLGALIVTFAAALDNSSLAGGVVVERHDGAQWLPLGPDQLLVGTEDALELKVLVRYGWVRGASYRVRLAGILDTQGRGLAQAQNFEWEIAAVGTSSDFSKAYGVAYDSARASVDTVGGRFPGGQNSLFQGLWTDPVTGIEYARARWYDARVEGWLSEDSLADIDSSNVYAFVSLNPISGRDPLGTFDRGSGFEEEARLRRERGEREAANQCRMDPLSPYCGLDWHMALGSFFGDHYEAGESAELIPYEAGTHRGIFVNGILNPPARALWYHLQAELMFKARLYPVHNPTRGFWLDAAQVQLVNKLGIVDETTRAVIEAIRVVLSDLPTDQKVMVVGHSQGAAIVSTACSKLSPQERARIDLVTIGGAAYGVPNGFNSVEMFINSRDIVPMLLGGGAEGITQLIDQSDITRRQYYSTGFPAWFPTTHGVDDYKAVSRARPAGRTPFESELLWLLDLFAGGEHP